MPFRSSFRIFIAMEYTINIEPDKVQEFLQIVESLQNLGVVRSLSSATKASQKSKQAVENFYNQFQFEANNFKFNREEANER